MTTLHTSPSQSSYLTRIPRASLSQLQILISLLAISISFSYKILCGFETAVSHTSFREGLEWVPHTLVKPTGFTWISLDLSGTQCALSRRSQSPLRQPDKPACLSLLSGPWLSLLCIVIAPVPSGQLRSHIHRDWWGSALTLCVLLRGLPVSPDELQLRKDGIRSAASLPCPGCLPASPHSHHTDASSSGGEN